MKLRKSMLDRRPMALVMSKKQLNLFKLNKLWFSLFGAACFGLSSLHPALAACFPAFPQSGDTVICTGPSNPLSPSFFSAANDLNVYIANNASLSVFLGFGGTALGLVHVMVANNAPFTLGTYTILTAANSVIGTFAGAVPATMPFLDFNLLYGANNVVLQIARNGFIFPNIAASIKEILC